MEKQSGPATRDLCVEKFGICVDYFKNAKISVNASSQFERDIQQMYILWLRLTRMISGVLGSSSKELGTGSTPGTNILLGAVEDIRDIFEKAAQDAEQTAGSRFYDITNDLESDAHRLVTQLRSMANRRKSQFSADSPQKGGVPWTLSTKQGLPGLIGDLSHVMTNNEKRLWDSLSAAHKEMEMLCKADVSQMNVEVPQSMESVRKLVMDCDLDPLLQQALEPQVSSNNVYEKNLSEDGGHMRNGNIGSASRDNRYISNTSKGANSKLVNGDDIY